MAYQQGTTTGTFTGIGLDPQGDLGGFGGVKTSRTLLASNVAPPAKEKLNFGVVLLIIFSIFGILLGLAMLTNEDTVTKWPWILVLLAGIASLAWCCYFIRTDGRRRTAEFQAHLQTYLRNWICLRCGTIFVP
jgi:hypothetical protein